MGANISDLVERSPKSSQILLTFHSTAKWKAYFDCYKETNKLEVAQAFQVQAIPTFILMKKGKVVEKVMGPKREEWQKLIEKHRN
ncbi:hypothetical protein TanjilG_17586 [Lupinus angustifolius]|uniref:Thioredoxin domain-containing protein n=1 Tax=Lupinus angustifolius TaxID=3871 RepID=A0A1J7GIS2_LUPAN|nr:hypothetical protein TanjilG_17586 [Lupinus angustifolius]